MKRQKEDLSTVRGRLRAAVTSAGGVIYVAQKSGVVVRTLSHHLAGSEMKFGTAVALAKTCNVSLNWLATGEGPMRPGAPVAAAERGPSPTGAPEQSIDAAATVTRLSRLIKLLQWVAGQEGTDGIFLSLHMTCEEIAAKMKAAS